MALQISGLVSSLDTTTIISQLMEVEANPQTLLKNQLTAVQVDAAAYRAINTRFAALQSAAEALSAASTWTATKAASSAGTVAATAGASALPGSMSFHVDQLAASHSVVSSKTPPWSGTDAAYGANSIAVTVGSTTTTIPIPASGSAPVSPTLADAIAAINASSAGLAATAVQVSAGKYQLQVTASASGAAATFGLNDGATTWGVVTAGADAQLTVGTGPGKYAVSSSSNTFSGLMNDTTLTVGLANVDATVSVSKDPSTAATKVQNLVDAANSLLDSIASYTDAESTSAVLKGDSTLRGLASQILGMVSSAVGGVSASVAGLQLTKDGRFTFDKATFTSKLTSDPTTVRDLFTKTTMVDAGIDGIAGNADDTTSPVGLAAQLAVLAKAATDTTTGTITTLATSKDTLAKDLQDRIEAWDLRLSMRKETLTRQFTAMETALSTLHNQSSWLTSQLASLPSWSQSNKS